jgi:membrane associated rhomboid family serine protease
MADEKPDRAIPRVGFPDMNRYLHGIMIPIGDDNPARRVTPYVNYLLLAANIFVFVYFQGLGGNLDFTYSYSAVPAEIITGRDLVTDPEVVRDPFTGHVFTIPGLGVTLIPVWLTLFTAMFMHGGISHIAGNMLYLWVFGDNLEHRLGHGRYLLFYLLCGVLASIAHVATTLFSPQNALVPSLGASGAISGIMGAYIILFPGNRVTLLFFPFTIRVSALVALGFWIAMQVINGMGMLGGDDTGVAYAAHIGGFVAGMMLIGIFDRDQEARITHR